MQNHWKQYLTTNISTIVIVTLMFLGYHVLAAPDRSTQAAPTGSPSVIPYQGTLTDANGNPVDGNIDITFSFYDVSSGGTALWSEAHTGDNAVPVNSGLFNVNLGSLNPIPDSLLDVETLYLGVQIESDSEMIPREVVGSVPLAMKAFSLPDASVTTSKLNIDDNLNMQGHDIINIHGVDLPFRLLSERAWEITSQDSGSLTDTGIRSTVNEKNFAFWNPDGGTILSIRAINGGGFMDMHGHPIKNVGAIIEANLQTVEERESEYINRFERGDVLCWDTHKSRLERCNKTASPLVFAVADENGKPIILGAEPIKVLGPVVPGDILVSSDISGYAVAWSQVGKGNPPAGVVIAKALETLKGNRGVVKAMIIVH